MLERLGKKLITPESALVYFGVIAGVTDKLLLDVYNAGVFDYKRGVDLVNFIFVDAVFAFNMPFLLQLGYVGEIRGINSRLYNRGYVSLTKFSHSIPPIF
jgi:hypothetical protein